MQGKEGQNALSPSLEPNKNTEDIKVVEAEPCMDAYERQKCEDGESIDELAQSSELLQGTLRLDLLFSPPPPFFFSVQSRVLYVCLAQELIKAMEKQAGNKIAMR